MSNVSRFISFVIGIIVLILLFVLIANRFNAQKRTATANGAVPTVTVTPTPGKGFDLFGLFRKNTPTPTVTPTMTFTQQMNTTMGTTTYNGQTPSNIPNTGAPTLLIPLATAGLALGMYLRKRG